MKKLIILFALLTIHYSLFTPAYSGGPPKRIVSLAPSTTEILFALGLGDRIVGVTNFCDYPEEAKKKAKVGGMSNPSLEAVVSLKPDIVVMTTDGNPKEFDERLRSMDIKTYIFNTRNISELSHGIVEMGSALGAKESAEKLARDIETSINKLRSRKSRVGSQKKKVIFILWPEPLIVAGQGTAIDDAITLLGAENIASKAGSAYPKYSVEELIRQSPDVIFIGKSMGVDIRDVSKGLLKKMASVPGVKNGAVFYMSDNLYRLGPRVIKGIEEMSECLK